MTDQLTVLLERVDDPVLRDSIKAQVAALKSKRRFGLVFEDQLPESVSLPSHPIRRGVDVLFRATPEGAVWHVQKVAKGIATLMRDDETVTAPVGELVVSAEFGTPVYPGLKMVDSIVRGDDKPSHIVINGENHHALEALAYTHTGKVDCIYIDPPYNTGGDLTYNDKRVSREDTNRHSKWLSFMDRRLRLARGLLKDTGVIIVAIDDNEHAHLKILMDQIFGETNFISNVIWQGSRKNDSRYISSGHDYMLVYAGSETAMSAAGVRWREKKPGVDRVLTAAKVIWNLEGPDQIRARLAMKQWFAALAKDDPALAMARYTFFDADGTVSRDGNITWPGGGGPSYDVLHPVTGLPVPVPKAGWRFSSAARMDEAIKGGEIIFGIDHTKPISLKKHLEQTQGQVATSVFDRQRTHATRHLDAIIGEKRFTHPKDQTILSRWIDIVTSANTQSVILDFFAGSGSTVEAVMSLNSADGGRRQVIAITNNEVDPTTAKALAKAGLAPGDAAWEAQGIFEHVTKPRIQTVVTGKREDGSTYSDGMDENVEFFQLTYLDAERVRVDAAYEGVAPLLWLRAGGRGRIIHRRQDTFDVTEHYGVLFDTDRWRAFIKALPATANTAFVVTDSDSVFAGITAELPAHIEPVRLYENYLSTFVINQQRQENAR